MRTDTFRRGSRLGKYRLERRLGMGTFAEVWRARDLVQHRRFALKIVFTRAVDEHGREAIEHEARVAARLDHPNVVALRNADWIDSRFVLATDLADTSLAGYTRARRSPRVALHVVRQVAAGLAHAHLHRILHLDLKPENVLVFPDGRAAIGDFGTSRLLARGPTRTYLDAGTLGYMAPEQAYGRAAMTSDVFSFGLIAYQLITGELLTWPFEWPSRGHERFASRVPGPVQTVLRRAAEFQPRRRYPDGVALHEALEAAFQRATRLEQREATNGRRRRSTGPPPSPIELEAALFGRRVGRRLGMRYHCHHCQGPIAEAMSHCPWCGESGHSFRDVTASPLVCPDCERGVLPEWKACPWCFPGRFAGNGKTPRPDVRAVRRCAKPGCAGELRPFMRYCPQCKTKPRRLWSHPDLPDRCPRCRWPVHREFWRFCAWCGRREPAAGTFLGRRKKGTDLFS